MPYRIPDLPDRSEPPPSSLVYEAIDRGQSQSSSVVFFKLFSLPVVASVAAAVVVGPTAGLFALVGTAAFAWTRRARTKMGAILRVEEGVLFITSRSTGAELLRLKLREVVDVRLDSKTIQRVVEGGSAIPAMRFLDSRVAPEIENARIVVVGERAEARLSEEYLAHMDASEWLGKVRVFLRKHGWVPRDERDEHDADQEIS
jgi:hypothetical protein